MDAKRADMTVMLSYSSNDIAHRDLVAQHLRLHAIEPWIDSDPAAIRPGQKWRPALFDILRTCEACIPILSHSYLASDACRMEAFVARNFGRPMLPIMVEDCYDDILKKEETRALQDIFMVRLHRLSAVGLPITEGEALDRVVEAILSKPHDVAATGLVYISYARDAVFATRLADGLSARSVPAWVATRHVRVGDNWRDAQAKAMMRAACHVIVLDDEMLARDVLRTEILLSQARGLPTVPLLPPRLTVADGARLRRAMEAKNDLAYRALADYGFTPTSEDADAVVEMVRSALT